MLRRLLPLFTALLFTMHVQARQVADIDIPEQITSEETGEKLLLNGAGIRSKFFFDIYVGALYLSHKANSTADILAQQGTNRIIMHFLYDEVEQEKLVDGWNDGFRNNHLDAQFDTLKGRLETFNSYFQTVKRGDRIQFDYLHGQTEVRINQDLKGVIKGRDFNQALLRVWLGEEPADGDLKQAMLGRDD